MQRFSAVRSGQILGLLCGLVGGAVLLGWTGNSIWLKSVVPGFTAMNPVTALCFAAAGLSLMLLSSRVPGRSRRLFSQAAGAAIALVALLRLSTDGLGIDVQVDQWFFAASLEGNRMAPNTAVCFLLIGVALLLLDVVTSKGFCPAQLLLLMVATISLVSLVGYGYGAESFYHIAYIPMAVHTAVGFQLLSIGMLLSRADRGVMAVLLHPGPGGIMARRLLPAVVGITTILGWLCLTSQSQGYYGPEFSGAFMVATTIMFFSVTMVWIAAALNRTDEKRNDAEQSIRRFNEELEGRVEERTAELAKRDLQLRQSQKMEAIGTLAGGVAHEFNNLLQAIQGYTHFAMAGLEVENERYKDLQQILNASERAATLTRQLLGFSRRDVLEMANVEPNDAVRSLTKMIRPLIGEHIKIEMSLGKNLGLVHADPGHLQQMLMNLCVNARDAMPHGGQLTIKTEDVVLSEAYCDVQPDLQPGRYLLLTVGDSGCGMPPEIREHIFEPFFTTKGVGKGTGLGLATVYGIVQQHQGAIRVYSEPGIGTTFRIYLPTIDRAEAATVMASSEPASGGTETILIAEDDAMVRDLTVRILEGAGYQTLVAADGEEAVQIFESHINEVSLALLDVVMPKLGGREALQKLQALKPSIQAVFCSGYDPEMAQVGFVVNDQTRLIQKPFDPHQLLAAIRETLDETACVSVA